MTKMIINSPYNNSLRFPTLFPTDIFKEFDRFFTDFLDVDKTSNNLSLRKGFPKGDVFYDKSGNIVVELALAGFSREQLSVKVEDNKLVVSGFKSEDGEDTHGRSLARRSFSKEFPNFTNEWDLKSSDVSYRDGLLRVVVPRFEQVEETATELEIK